MEPVLLLGKEKFAGVDIRIRVKGGGRISQIYGMLIFCLVKGLLVDFLQIVELCHVCGTFLYAF